MVANYVLRNVVYIMGAPRRGAVTVLSAQTPKGRCKDYQNEPLLLISQKYRNDVIPLN